MWVFVEHGYCRGGHRIKVIAWCVVFLNTDYTDSTDFILGNTEIDVDA